MKPLITNSSDEIQLKKADEKLKINKSQDKEDLRFLLNHDQGRRFIWKALEFCGLYKDSMTGSSATFYNEGRRSVGIWLIDELMQADKLAYSKMMIENYNKENKDV